MNQGISRRDAMKAIGAAAIVGSLPGAVRATPQAAALPSSKKLRIAHMTDFHVQPERRANEGMIAALQHAQSLKDQPQLIVTGGDSIMDAFESDDARTKIQWDIWRSAIKNECGVPVKSCIGNHDIWGWNKAKSKATGNEPNYGKQRAVEMLEIPARHYAHDLPNNWKLIVLDSVQSDGGSSYRAFIDPEQLGWLQGELRSTPAAKSIVILSHIPIMAAAAILWAKQNEQGDFTISGAYVHQDVQKLKTLFAAHPNVKLCVSGHLHHVDRADYNGVTYLCNGAVCGNWWKGRHKDTDEGYAVLDLFDDGRFEHQYVKYGWRAQK